MTSPEEAHAALQFATGAFIGAIIGLIVMVWLVSKK